MKSIIQWHKRKLYRPFKKRFGLSGYQMCWIAFGKGVIIGILII